MVLFCYVLGTPWVFTVRQRVSTVRHWVFTVGQWVSTVWMYVCFHRLEMCFHRHHPVSIRVFPVPRLLPHCMRLCFSVWPRAADADRSLCVFFRDLRPRQTAARTSIDSAQYSGERAAGRTSRFSPPFCPPFGRLSVPLVELWHCGGEGHWGEGGVGRKIRRRDYINVVKGNVAYAKWLIRYR